MNNIRLLDFEYATFRESVKQEIIKNLCSKPTSVLDPMAGTAPLIPFFQTRGYNASLYDVLPIHLHINSAKQLSSFNSFKATGPTWFEETLTKALSPLDKRKETISEKWIDESILKILIDAWHCICGYDEDTTKILRALLILTIKYFSSFTATGNPTWIKPGGITSGRSVRSIVREKVGLLKTYYQASYADYNGSPDAPCTFAIGDASHLQLNTKFDTIITSPPYCNRLDYTSRYSPELLFLSQVGFPTRTENIIGTNAVFDFQAYKEHLAWIRDASQYTYRLLRKIERKGKEAECGYYVRYYTKYFSTLFTTFERLSKYLSRTGKMYIVIQDNAHRGELIEIDKSLGELLSHSKLNAKVIKKWERNHLGRKNISKEYKIIHIRQYEKLLVVYR